MANNFRTYWLGLCNANPPLRDDNTKMTISSESLRAQLQKAYVAGAADKVAFAEALKKTGQPTSPLNGILESLLGGTGR